VRVWTGGQSSSASGGGSVLYVLHGCAGEAHGLETHAAATSAAALCKGLQAAADRPHTCHTDTFHVSGWCALCWRKDPVRLLPASCAAAARRAGCGS
jgi:hypothetical protein